jgi:cytochrome b pre-mRNA-processing protein 3
VSIDQKAQKTMPLSTLFRKAGPPENIHEIYRIIVDQARQPRFYTDFGVPDTVDGRFEMVTLHAFLVLRRLKGATESSTNAAQDLFDLMFEDMDVSLREMGAGDMGVGKRVKAMVQAFYGRIASYEAGLAEDQEALEAALTRNVYATAEAGHPDVAGLARYVRLQTVHMAKVDLADLENGKFGFEGAE